MYYKKNLSFILIISCISSAIFARTTPENSFAQGFYKNTLSGQNKTAVCFLNDHGDEDYPNGAVKNEFVKLTIDKAPHIFVTPNILRAYQQLKKQCLLALAGLKIVNPFKEIVIRQNKLVTAGNNFMPLSLQVLSTQLTAVLSFNLEQWEVYDTRKGLFYVHHKAAPHIKGIKLQSFQRITNLDRVTIPSSSQTWTQNLNALFDPIEWNKNNKQIFIFFCGHGTPTEEGDFACGYHGPTFARVLHYFNTHLRFEMLGVITCYWSCDRILRLMQEQYNYLALNFTLCTPISLEVPVYPDWHPAIIDYENGKSKYTKNYDSFFQGLNHAVSNIADMHKLRRIFDNVDAVKIGQTSRPSIIYAHSTTLYEL